MYLEVGKIMVLGGNVCITCTLYICTCQTFRSGFFGWAVIMSSSPKKVRVFAADEAPLNVVRAAPDNGSHAQRFHICPVESPVSKTSGCGIFAVQSKGGDDSIREA